jgi:tetratricopeptide (TPR) repeat protein
LIGGFEIRPRRRITFRAAVRGLLFNMRRCCLCVAVAVLGGLLLTGCRTVPGGKSAEKASARSKAGRAGDIDLEARAEAHAHYAAGVIHELNNETDAALKEFYQAALKDPENESLILEVSWRFLQNKQPEKALEILQSAVRQPGASGAIYARLGFVYSRLGRQEEAITANRMAVKKMPRSLSGYRNLFLNYLQIKQPEEALQILDEAAKQSNAGAGYYIGLAELFGNYAQQFPSQRQAVKAKALAVLERAEKLKPAGTQLQIRLADGFYLAGDSDKAATLYLGVLDQLADLPRVRILVRARLADIYLRNHDHKRASEQLEAITRDDPANAQAYYSLASIAYDEQRWADAADYLRKALLFKPDFEQAYYDLASAQLALGKADEALITLGQAKEKFPQNFVLEYLLGVTEGRQKNYAEAVKHFTAAEVIAQATDTNRLTHVFYFEVGSAFERKGDRAEAEDYLEKCLKLKPDFAEAQNYLGYMWAERGEKLDQAQKLITQALEAQPKNAAFLDSMGWVLFKQKQPKEALDYILKAIQLNKEPDATLYEHLGDIYDALKETNKAREAWRKSLSVEKNDAVQKKLDSSQSK